MRAVARATMEGWEDLSLLQERKDLFYLKKKVNKYIRRLQIKILLQNLSEKISSF